MTNQLLMDHFYLYGSVISPFPSPSTYLAPKRKPYQLFSVAASSSIVLLSLRSYCCCRDRCRRWVFSGGRRMGTTKVAGSTPSARSIAGSDHLRHVDSMTRVPSGAGKISYLNAVVLGEALASEENDLVFPNPEFSAQALVSSPEQVFFFTFCHSFG